MFNKELLQTKHAIGKPYLEFVADGEAEGHHLKWNKRYDELELDAEQLELVKSFTRQMNVLCLTGHWCGDCALQGAAMGRIAEANPLIDLRFIPRAEEHGDLIVPSQINGGYRVPVSWFLAEDYELVSWFGDRTLSRYRSLAKKAFGEGSGKPGCNSPRPNDPVREVLREVLEEFERVQLLLRLSGRLREKHGD